MTAPTTYPFYLLWYDPSKTKTVLERLNDASAYYAEKYGTPPNTAIICPAQAPEGFVPGEAMEGTGLVVFTGADVQSDHVKVTYKPEGA